MERRIKIFKCVVCNKNIGQPYVVSCPIRKYCSKKCKWTFENRNKSKHVKKIKSNNKTNNKRDYNKKYYEINKEKEIERVKKYQKENRKKITAHNKERRRRNIEEQNKNKNRSRAWYEKNKDKFNDHKKKYKKKNPDKVFATKELNKAVSRGDIIPQACEVCGKDRADAHHDDYNFPLKVRWLCRSCHKEWHLYNEPVRKKQ